MKIFVFALLKTVQNLAERNSGRILPLFKCNDRGFLLLREANKRKFLPGLVSPIKVWFQREPKKAWDSTWTFLCLRSWKLSKTKLTGILDVFCDYLSAIKGGFLLLREATKPKFQPGLVSPIKVWFQRVPKKASDSTWKFLCLRSWKLSKTKLSGILDVFCDYSTAMTGVFCYCGRRLSQNVYLV